VAVYDRNFVVDNAEDGYDFYRLDNNCTFIQSYITRLSILRQPNEVVFAEEGEAVVGGSDHGAVYVFGVHTGAQLDVIQHEKDAMVQTIAVCSMTLLKQPDTDNYQTVDLKDGGMIAAGSSGCDPGKQKISLWRRDNGRETSKPRRTVTSVMWTVIQVVMAIATLVLVCQSVVKMVSKTLQ
jgi:hypothetical protein